MVLNQLRVRLILGLNMPGMYIALIAVNLFVQYLILQLLVQTNTQYLH